MQYRYKKGKHIVQASLLLNQIGLGFTITWNQRGITFSATFILFQFIWRMDRR